MMASDNGAALTRSAILTLPLNGHHEGSPFPACCNAALPFRAGMTGGTGVGCRGWSEALLTGRRGGLIELATVPGESDVVAGIKDLSRDPPCAGATML